MKAQWQKEKEAIQGIRETKERLEAAKGEVDRAEREADLEARRQAALQRHPGA